jgi:hypothetical protein
VIGILPVPIGDARLPTRGSARACGLVLGQPVGGNQGRGERTWSGPCWGAAAVAKMARRLGRRGKTGWAAAALRVFRRDGVIRAKVGRLGSQAASVPALCGSTMCKIELDHRRTVKILILNSFRFVCSDSSFHHIPAQQDSYFNKAL